MFSLPTSALRELDLPGAVASEAERPPWGLPSTAIQRTLKRYAAEVADYTHGALRHGVELTGAEVIPVPKPRGLRPLAVLSIEERIAYRALVAPLREALELRDRTYATFREFSAGPIQESNTEYIVRADVASFYQYVDHDLLHDEIVDQTGNAAVAQSISALLHGIQQRRIGLPQLYDPSDWLSEIAIDIVERRLLRAGYRTYRFNDDFRVAARSWAEANEAREALDHELRRLGLSLNDEKTFTQSREHYERWVDLPDQTWTSIVERLGLDIAEPEWGVFGDYQDTIVPLVEDELEDEVLPAAAEAHEDLRERWVGAAQRALDLWLESVSTTRDRLEESMNRRLLRQALGILTAAGSPLALEYCKPVLVWEPHFTYLVARYVRALTVAQSEYVAELLAGWIDSDVYLNKWQQLWLLEPVLLLPSLSPTLVAWAKTLLTQDNPDVVRARAAATLLYKRAVPPSEVAGVYDAVRPAARPDCVAALGAMCSGEDPILRSVSKDSALNRLIVQGSTW